MATPGRSSRWDRWLASRIRPENPTRLTQQRIYILPTLEGVAFGCVLVVMLLAAINYQNSLAYGLTFLLAAVLFISVLHTYRNMVGLVLSAANSPPVFAGDVASFRIHLDGAGRARRAIVTGWQAAPTQTAPASSHTVDVEHDALVPADLSREALTRGRFRPGRLRVESRFPLGLIKAWSWVDLDLATLVYPRPVEGDLPLDVHTGSEKEAGAQSPVLSMGVDDFQGLRRYQPGDSKRRLHWKAYSRGQGLLVKDFAAAGGQDVILDFDALAGAIEPRLSLLCYWVLELSGRQQTFALRLPGEYIAADVGDAHRDRCLRVLALHGVQA
ncbi:DUF58 domain-containing protein [Pseudomonas matsuisoli]|uniref:DUF58 domain-containing protein n=1 Tax=Pseudomonas matsuisoli TaxID=1515666 RepID=A0A917Q0W0_9PSED|nr:DUF58 domain-containing protein [Pseudomonas matsuisoli]GGK05740.1 hypothetical protein GCM10009304_34790 [Pseudomonas matsuisoli]